MKIQVIKKADKKPSPYSACNWLVDALPEPQK